MPKYRKKPVEIEAIQWKATSKSWDEIQGMGLTNTEPGEMGTKSFYIQTLEGKMKADHGDWIIKGLAGEFYPCKNDLFLKSYELVED